MYRPWPSAPSTPMPATAPAALSGKTNHATPAGLLKTPQDRVTRHCGLHSSHRRPRSQPSRRPLPDAGSTIGTTWKVPTAEARPGRSTTQHTIDVRVAGVDVLAGLQHGVAAAVPTVGRAALVRPGCPVEPGAERPDAAVQVGAEHVVGEADIGDREATGR